MPVWWTWKRTGKIVEPLAPDPNSHVLLRLRLKIELRLAVRDLDVEAAWMAQ